ncbi:MAG: hypothetical protein PHW27_13540 [Melioribacteraceae bacterium]|nr:hypothetical protein [Melioribacteraceae bacterium]
MHFKYSFVLLFLYYMGSDLYSQHISITPSLSFGVKGSSANLGAEISGLIYFDTSNFAFNSGYRLQHFGNAPSTEEFKDLSSTSSIIFVHGVYFLSMMKVRPYVGSGLSYYLSLDVSDNGNPELINNKKPENFDFKNQFGFDFLIGMHTYLDHIVSLKIEIRYSLFQTKLTAELRNLYKNEPNEIYKSETDFNSLHFMIGLNINF